MAKKDDTPQASKPEIKKPKHRSPNYPSITLEKAVELLHRLNTKYGKHPAPIGLVHELWKYKPGSGIANQAVAALKSFGLVEVTGEGDGRKVSPSKDGARVAGNAPDRAEILKRAALRPKIHREVLSHFGDSGLPVDDLLKQYLVWERPEGQRFNPDVVDDFIGRFRKTLHYAGVTVADKISNGEAGGDGVEDNQDDDESFQPPSNQPEKHKKRATMPGTKEDVFSLDDGALVVQWPERIRGVSKEDIEGWLKLVGNKVKRAVDESEDDSADDGKEE